MLDDILLGIEDVKDENEFIEKFIGNKNAFYASEQEDELITNRGARIGKSFINLFHTLI